MNISTRDKKILLMFSGVVVFGAGWFFGYRPQMEKAASIEASNQPLEEKLQNLVKLSENKDFYVEETAKAQEKISEYTSQFPSAVKEEDGIVLAQNIESSVGMQISNVGISTREFIAAMDGSTEEDLAQEDTQTMSEQANEQTKEQIDEIEGTDSNAREELQNASDAATGRADSDSSQTPVLYRTQDTLQFNGTYANLKDVVTYLAGQSGRMTLDNVNASYDTSTGNLTGSIVINLFSMTGTGNTYTEPDAGQVPYGVSNIFGTIEQNAASAPAGDTAQGSDTQEDGSDGQTDESQNSQEGENTENTQAPADTQGES